MDGAGAIAQQYQQFADRQAHGVSPSLEAWARQVADDPALLAQLGTLPATKRQPNLVFAALRWHGAQPGDEASLRRGLLDAWPDVAHTIGNRSTQTNEPARCAVLLPALHRISGPIALLELGAAAGLCLIPDRYSYAYSDGTVVHPADGPGELTIDCRVSAGHLPPDLSAPHVVWRAGLDLNPLDPSDPDTAEWLSALIWPEQNHRRDRLTAALHTAAAADIRIERGDLREGIGAFIAEMPRGVTPVVLHSATLAYLSSDERAAVIEALASCGAHWIAFEGRGVVPTTRDIPLPITPDTLFVTALDREPLALSDGHGDSVTILNE